MRILFLDIDGVIQLGTEFRFRHSKEEIRELCHELTLKYGRFDFDKWAQDDDQNPFWTVAAVRWDWNEACLHELRRVLEATGARIVLSSSWRSNGMNAMRALFWMHGLDGFLLDGTMPEGWNWEDAGIRLQKAFRTESRHPYGWVSERSVEILEYLDRHPEVTGYAAVDDMDLNDLLEGHFVQTGRGGLDASVADALIGILQKDGGPFALPEHVRTMSELKAIRERIPTEAASS